MKTPETCRFTKEHEWAILEGEKVRVGITDYAQKELGDVVFVELPVVGKAVAKGKACSSVESVKAVSDIYAPLDGTIIQVNEKLSDNPELINASPYLDGWIAIIEPKDKGQFSSLLTAKDYDAFIAQISK